MEFSKELLFFFSILGAFNGLVLAFYFLFVAKPKTISNRFLGALILMISIRVGKSVFFYFNPDLAFVYLQFGLTACFFIGPFLYFYVLTIITPQSGVLQYWKLHLLILAVIASIVGYVYPFETNIELWRPYVLRTIYSVWFLYIFASIYIMRFRIKKLFLPQERLNSMEIWILSLLVGNLILVSIYYAMDITLYAAGAIAFSFLVYLSVLFVFFNKKNKSILLYGTKKYGDKKINDAEASLLADKLHTLIVEEELYKNANLKLSEVAQHLQVLPHKLSQLINDNLGKSFAIFINEFRIEEAKKVIAANESLKLEAVGYDCGFNSKSTFYASFRKVTGTTPAKYKESLS